MLLVMASCYKVSCFDDPIFTDLILPIVLSSNNYASKLTIFPFDNSRYHYCIWLILLKKVSHFRYFSLRLQLYGQLSQWIISLLETYLYLSTHTLTLECIHKYIHACIYIYIYIIHTHTLTHTVFDVVLLTNALSKFSNTKASQPFISYLQILGSVDLFDTFVRCKIPPYYSQTDSHSIGWR